MHDLQWNEYIHNTFPLICISLLPSTGILSEGGILLLQFKQSCILHSASRQGRNRTCEKAASQILLQKSLLYVLNTKHKYKKLPLCLPLHHLPNATTWTRTKNLRLNRLSLKLLCMSYTRHIG